MEPSTVRVTTGTNQYHLSQQQVHPQEHHMLPQQPNQQTMPHSYHQYHQAQNKNQQQWNGYPLNRVKPCYACFQFGHREYNCPDDQAFERYTLREVNRMHERRCQQGNIYFQQPQQSNTWKQSEPQQLQGNSTARVVEPKLNVQSNNMNQVTQSRASATPASTNTRQ
jgi:hypothetical protein